jgi:hypothetical protein
VLIATLIMQVVESVIELRRTGEWRDGYAHEIAACCLRLAGLDGAEIARARETATRLTAAPLPAPGVTAAPLTAPGGAASGEAGPL